MSDYPGGPDGERRRRAEQETTQQPVIGPDGRPWQPQQQPQPQPPQQQAPYGGPPAPPPQSLGQGFGQQQGQYQQQPPQYAGPQYQQPGPPQGQQPYFPEGAQPCFPLVPTKLSPPARLLGWVPVVIAIIAFIGCFGPWAAAKVDGSLLGTSISVTNSVNAFNHQSCSSSGSTDGCRSSDSSDSSSSDTSSSPTSTSSDDDGSLWEGWVVSVVALLVAGLGVVRGLGNRVAALPAAITAAVGGLVLIGLPVYRLTWISDKSGDLKDAMKAEGLPAGFDVSLTSGWGLWVVLAMGVALLAAGIGGAVKRW